MRTTFRCIPFKIIVIVKNLLVWKTHIDRGTKLLFCLFEALKCPFWNLVPFSFLYILIQFFFLLFVVLYNAPSLAHCYARLKFFSLNGCYVYQTCPMCTQLLCHFLLNNDFILIGICISGIVFFAVHIDMHNQSLIVQ